MEVAKQISILKVDIGILTETNLLPSQSLLFSQFAPHYSCISATSKQRDSGVTILLAPSCKNDNDSIQSKSRAKLELSIKY